MVFGGMREVVGGHDCSGGTDDQHQVAGFGQFKGGLIGGQRNLFAKKDDIGFDEAFAGAVEGRLTEVQGFGVKRPAAAQADKTPGIAVEFDDVATAGFLVQVVDVLGNDALEPAHFFQAAKA